MLGIESSLIPFEENSPTTQIIDFQAEWRTIYNYPELYSTNGEYYEEFKFFKQIY